MWTTLRGDQVTKTEEAAEGRARAWRRLMALHGHVHSALEKVLQTEYDLTVVEFTVLDTLSRQEGWYMRMQQLTRATALSASATTRLVNRLEDRGLLARHLCADDRRGIYTELTPTGHQLLQRARPDYNRILKQALDTAATDQPELAPLLEALHHW
jgi:DNA-binding MarR family transcriptional regulator